jgi:NAD(P)-dependent dehydrogenase (short-subunit alcohol dehydrogenase family)
MIKEKLNLDGKLAFITGGARGIGKGYAMALAEFGANVAIADIDIDEAKKTAFMIRSDYGVKTEAFFIDARDSLSIRDTIKSVTSTFDNLDIAVNNAGIA